MNFNFDTTAGLTQGFKALPGNAIHEVIFDGCEAKDIQGKQDPSKVFKVLEIKFSNDSGSFTHTIWEPRESDMEDTINSFGNKQPANVKGIMLTLKHLIDAVNPTLAKQIDSKEKSLNAPNWNALRQLMVKETESGIGTKTKIKLLTRKTGEPCFPGFVAAYSKAGNLYMQTNFIGNNIFFTKKELENINKQKAAAPTNTASDFSFPTTETETKKESGYDFEDLDII